MATYREIDLELVIEPDIFEATPGEEAVIPFTLTNTGISRRQGSVSIWSYSTTGMYLAGQFVITPVSSERPRILPGTAYDLDPGQSMTGQFRFIKSATGEHILFWGAFTAFMSVKPAPSLFSHTYVIPKRPTVTIGGVSRRGEEGGGSVLPGTPAGGITWTMRSPVPPVIAGEWFGASSLVVDHQSYSLAFDGLSVAWQGFLFGGLCAGRFACGGRWGAFAGIPTQPRWDQTLLGSGVPLVEKVWFGGMLLPFSKEKNGLNLTTNIPFDVFIQAPDGRLRFYDTVNELGLLEGEIFRELVPLQTPPVARRLVEKGLKESGDLKALEVLRRL